MDTAPVRLHYFYRTANVGDVINVDIVRALTGRAVQAYDGDAPHLLCIGSMMAHSKPESLVWGTGAMYWNKLGGAKPSNVYAVRGEKTARAFLRAGTPLNNIPLGDPGFLAPDIIGIRAAEPIYDLGLIPHYIDQTHEDIIRLSKSDRCLMIDVRADPATVLTNIARCRVIASTSLHGLIFAEALGLPNLWIKATGKLAGGTFKFEDWYSTTRNPQRQLVQISGDTLINHLISAAELRESTIDKNALISSFPHSKVDHISGTYTA